MNHLCLQIRRTSYYPAAVEAFTSQYAREKNISLHSLNEQFFDEPIIIGEGKRIIYLRSPSHNIAYKVSPAVIETVLTLLQSSISTKLRGQSAYSGTYKGKVVIVFTIDDAISVNIGDILVAYSTNPQLLPAMKRAGAIITQEGGITSHAAILARELKKPCIVGIPNLMSLLVNGTIVEVDATNGVVRELLK